MKLRSMEEKISYRLFLMGFFGLLFTAALCIFVFHKAFTAQAWTGLEREAELVSAGYDLVQDPQQLTSFVSNDLRITLISQDGSVLFESATDQPMENHLSRPEIRQAMEQAPENVTFAGFVDRETLREAYCGADVFAFMSHEETEGIVVLEALACGIPTVVRDIPVYNGWLREGQNVYKASGTDEFQQKAEGLLTGTLPDLTAAGRRVAEERSLSVMGERLREVYRRMDILPAAQPAAKTNLPQAERPVQHSFTP